MKFVAAMVLLVSSGALALACGSSDETLPSNVRGIPTAGGSPIRGQGGADLEPSLEITSPHDGASVNGPDVTIKVAIDDFKIVDKIGQPDQRGEGHILYSMDPPATGAPDDGQVFETTDREHKWKDVPRGEHTFAAQLVTNNGSMLRPQVGERIKIVVR